MSPRSGERVVTVRIVLPIALYGDEDGLAARKAVASWLDKRLRARGFEWTVGQRADSGVTIAADYLVGLRVTSAGALTAATNVVSLLEETIERAVERADKRAPIRELFAAMNNVTVKTEPRRA